VGSSGMYCKFFVAVAMNAGPSWSIDLSTNALSTSPSSSPYQPPCPITWNLYNSQTDTLVAPLVNGAVIPSPPPCGKANIEGVVPCGASYNQVTLELWRGSQRIRRQPENVFPYFLFGNDGRNVFDGKIAAGNYGVRAIVNGKVSSFTNFTLGGRCS
jgi:hypothetical protein